MANTEKKESNKEILEFKADGENSSVADPVDTGSTKRPADKTDGEKTPPKLTKVGMVAKMAELVHGMKKEQLSKAYSAVVSALNGPTDGATHVKESAEEEITSMISEEIGEVFEGSELTEEAKLQIGTLFEAAVAARSAEAIAIAEEKFEIQLEEARGEIETATMELVSSYVEEAAKSWVEENRVALESNIRSEILESFVQNLHKVFVEHYIDIPEDKVDVVESLTQKVESLETDLEEQVQANQNLQLELNKASAAKLFAEAVEGLTESQVEKMRTLTEGFDVNDLNSYQAKLEIVRESSFINTKKPVGSAAEQLNEEVELDEGNDNKAKITDPDIAVIAQHLSGKRNR